MAKDSFKEQYPDYALIPEKRWVPKWLATTLMVGGALVISIGLLLGTLYVFSNVRMPVPNMAGMNRLSAETARNLALSQAEAGDYVAAAKNFSFYFSTGGDHAPTMAVYALVLKELGLEKDAEYWSEKSRVGKFESK